MSKNDQQETVTQYSRVKGRCQCNYPDEKVLVGGPEKEPMGVVCDNCGGEL